jgi:ATP phosphoribosyltransferase
MNAPLKAAALAADDDAPLILALPKGRILYECGALLARAEVHPAADYTDESSRRLRFPTNDPGLDVVRVRPFDVATFVAFGGASLGICGADVLMEFDYPEIYAPLDLGIGACRVSVAELAETAGADDPSRWSNVRVATKYPNIARRHYAARGVHAEVVHLNGAMELAPSLGLSRVIVGGQGGGFEGRVHAGGLHRQAWGGKGALARPRYSGDAGHPALLSEGSSVAASSNQLPKIGLSGTMTSLHYNAVGSSLWRYDAVVRS